MIEWIHQSNLIEGVDEAIEDERGIAVWESLLKCTKLTLDTILAIHLDIMGNINPVIAGELRTWNVSPGGRPAPDWTLVSGLLQEWIRVFAVSRNIGAIISAHIDFEKIHPFADGNGRTGRMLMNWQRAQIGEPPMLIKASKREEYYKWFQ